MKRQRGDSSSFTSKGAGKRRKSYVVHKERETWTDEEHAKFVLALEKYGRAWTKIEEIVGTKTVSQIRSHAQKYFEKIEKQGDMEVVRPADGNTLIEVPWIALPDVLAEKRFLLDRDNFQAWMQKNHLGATRPLPPPDLIAINTDQTQQAISFLDRAVQSVPQFETLPGQFTPQMELNSEEKEKEKEKDESNEINWNRIMKYIAGLARESLEPTAIPEVTIANLNSNEKEFLRVIMTQNIAAVSVDSIRLRIERFMTNFDKSVNPPLSSPSSPFSIPTSTSGSQAFPSFDFGPKPTSFSSSTPVNPSSVSSPPLTTATTSTPQTLTNSMELFSNFVIKNTDSSRREKD